VVVYSDDIYGASVVWFALQVMGFEFDSWIYRWQELDCEEKDGKSVESKRRDRHLILFWN
jgi:hypothetical protein